MTLFTVPSAELRKNRPDDRATHVCGFIKIGAVHTYIVGAFHNKLFPPGLFHIILQLHAKVAVIPGVGKSAVNFIDPYIRILWIWQVLRFFPWSFPSCYLLDFHLFLLPLLSGMVSSYLFLFDSRLSACHSLINCIMALRIVTL